jgi:quinoprotein glucose dehydrogenase
MSRRLAPLGHVARRLARLAIVASLALNGPSLALAGPAEGKDGLVELGKTDARLKGYYAPQGFKVRIIAAEPTLLDPAAMAFDDLGNLFVAEWRPADRSIETWDTLALPEGGTTRVQRARKSTSDVVKWLKDADGDGVYESSEVVVDGCEMPSSILPWKNSLLLACVGRLERWSDEDGDGKFETRTILADGFAAIGRRGLGGITLGADGWLYLASGDNDNHVVGSDGSRVDLARTGGIFRSKLDGSKLSLFAMGLRDPCRGMAFDGTFDPFLLDGDHEDGSKYQGVRLVSPVEDGDYGWRLRPGVASGPADFDRAAVDGERPGKLPVVARLGRGSSEGLVIYNGSSFPEAFRGTLIGPDSARRVVRGFRIESKGGPPALKGESTLMTAEDDQFRPSQAIVGADGALYVLDRRGHSTDGSPPWGAGKSGRLYRVTWEGDGATPALPTKPNNWQRLFQATFDQLVFQYMVSTDFAEADRALRELVDRGPSVAGPCLGWASNQSAPLHARLLGIQGARQFWDDHVELAMIGLLEDSNPDVRRLAAQALAREPRAAIPRLIPKLVPHLDDPDGRVAREVAFAIGRHAEPRPQQTAAILLRWLFAHPKAHPSTRDAFLRSLERLGDVGVEEVALAVRTRRGVERETAVDLFSGLRSAQAAEQLDGLVKIPDLTSSERLALIRKYPDFPIGIPVPTQGLADWVIRHSEVDPAVKVAALQACRLAGNPASSLVLSLLDDEDESVRLAATSIAAQARPPGALEKLADRLKEKDATYAERLAIVRALRLAGPKAFASLDAAYLAAESPDLRRAALRSMADADRAKATSALESALAGPDPALRLDAARILGESSTTAPLIARAFLNRTLGSAELPAVVASLRKHDGVESRKLLSAIEEDATRAGGTLNPGEDRARLAQGGDYWAGLGVFFRESSRCSTCHRVEGRGLGFGPPLTLDGSPPPADRLVDSILTPSRDVSAGYGAVRVTFKDGRVLRGVVSSKDGKFLTLREPAGREFRFDREAIASQQAEPGSLMPAAAALELTHDDLADVVAFLRNKPAQDALKHGPKRVDRVLAVGPFPLGADQLRIPLDRVNPAQTLAGQDGATPRWIGQEASGWGTLNLRGLLGSRPARAYLAVQVRSAREQVAALRFAVEGASRAYLNGSKVADAPEHDPSALARSFDRPAPGCLAPLPDLARLKLKPGWNLLIIAVDHFAVGDARATFEIASPEPIELRLPVD